MAGLQFHSGRVEAPFGPVTVVADDEGVRCVSFGGEHGLRLPAGATVTPDPAHHVVAAALGQLREYLDGERTGFDLPLSLDGTEFQIAAWRALAEVPFGETSSYAAQAASIGRPTATRAVGAANGRNPVAIVLPCHRIVGSDGSLTGFAGGLETKKWLLAHERAVRERRGAVPETEAAVPGNEGAA